MAFRISSKARLCLPIGNFYLIQIPFEDKLFYSTRETIKFDGALNNVNLTKVECKPSHVTQRIVTWSFVEESRLFIVKNPITVREI